MQATGGCQCGQVRYVLAGESLMIYACHCHDCQRRTGSAFSEGMLIAAEQLALEGELTSWQRIADSGVEKTRHSCASCGNIMYGTAANMPGLMLLQAGTLDDTRAVQPDVHIWLQSAQQWVAVQPGVPGWQTQPDDMADMLRAAQAYRQSLA
ncbi:MAG: GFA family protein [Halieaceae bacterium]|nr:GFA family protein [Halieaceae bacterium]